MIADHQNIAVEFRARREQGFERSAFAHHRPGRPAGAPQFPSRGFRLSLRPAGALAIEPNGLAAQRAAHAGWKAPRYTRHPQRLGNRYDDGDTVSPGFEPGKKARCPPCSRRAVETQDQAANVPCGSACDEDRPGGVCDDGARHATGKHAPYGAMTTPAERNRVGAKASRLRQDGVGRRIVQRHDICIRPAPREDPARRLDFLIQTAHGSGAQCRRQRRRNASQRDDASRVRWIRPGKLE